MWQWNSSIQNQYNQTWFPMDWISLDTCTNNYHNKSLTFPRSNPVWSHFKRSVKISLCLLGGGVEQCYMGFRTTTRQIQEKANLRNTRTRYKPPIFPRYIKMIIVALHICKTKYKKLFFCKYFLHFIAKHKRTAQSKWRSFHPKQLEKFISANYIP